MIRVIVRSISRAGAANVGGPADTWFQTFDVDAPSVEAALVAGNLHSYCTAEVVGVEVLTDAEKNEVTP